MEIEKYNWIYRVENSLIEIIPDKKSKKPEPEAFYKYYNLNENSIDSITNNYIYASHPDQLNDPLDCNYRLISFNDIYEITKLLTGIMGPEEIKKKWNENRKAFIQDVQFNYLQRAFIDLGIFSLTSDPLNILMWSHYSNNNGFVIQYNIEKLKEIVSLKEIAIGPFQINYQNEILAIPFDAKSIALMFLYLTNIKSKKWKYENEWRMIFGREKMYTPGIDIPDPNGLFKNSRKFKIENKTVEKIILGNKFFDQKEFNKSSNNVSIKLKNSENSRGFFYKKALLDYIIQNNIPSEIIGVDPKKFFLKPLKIKLQRTKCDYEYILYMNN